MTPEKRIELTERITELLPGRQIIKIGDGTVLFVGNDTYIDLHIAEYESTRNELEKYINDKIK